MRRPRSRARKVTITDELVELYRKAQPLWNARYGKSLTDEELATVQAFDRAVGRKPWEHSLLSPRCDDDPLRSALLAKCGAEAEAWRAYARKWWKLLRSRG
jgi:hypothetical protein